MEPEIEEVYADPKTQRLVDRQGRPVDKYELGDINDIKRDIARLGFGVEINVSAIPNAGYGLFASRRFRKNEIITYYDGAVAPRIEPSEIQPKYKSHAREINKFYTMFGDYTASGVQLDLDDPAQRLMLQGTGGASRANAQIGVCSDGNNADWLTVRSKYNQENPFQQNPFDIVVLIYAKRRIEPGEEIFVSYGEDYWKNASKGGNKVPQFITREKYEREQRAEQERRKKLKRVAPIVIVRDEETDKKPRITMPCRACGNSTPVVDEASGMFFCNLKCYMRGDSRGQP